MDGCSPCESLCWEGNPSGGCGDRRVLQQSRAPGPKGLQAPQPHPALASPGPPPAPNEEQTQG